MSTNKHRTCDEDEVFISYNDDEFGETYRKIKLEDVKDGDYIIGCSVCGKNARHIDELFPCYLEDNLCKEHMDEVYFT